MLENQTQKASKMAPSRAPKGDLKCIKFRLKSTLGSLMYPKVTPRCPPSGHQAPRIVKNRLEGYKKDTQHVPNRSKNTTMGPKLAPRSKTSEAQAIKSSGDQEEGPAAGAKPSEYHAIDSRGPVHPLNPNPNPKNSKIDSRGQSEYHAIDSRRPAHPLNPNPNPKNLSLIHI